MDRSHSESEINEINSTPSNPLIKRRRKDDCIDDFSKFKQEVLDMISVKLSFQEQELKKITTTLKDIKQSNLDIVNSVSFLSAQNEELKSKITSLEKRATEDKQHISMLEEKIEELQIKSRKNNIELKNVPKKNNETKEDLIDIVTNLSRTVCSTINKSDISDIYRIRSKKEDRKNTPIVVETCSTLAKTDILKSCKMYNIKNKSKLCAKHLGLHTQEDTPIFIAEQLTPKQSRLHFLARDLVKSKKYKFAWTAFGRVYMRRDENSKVIPITSEEQDVGMEYDVVAESFETSVPWDRTLPLCRNVKQRVRDECAKRGITKYLISCRLTQTYDAGCCIYFYFGHNSANVKDPVATYEAIEEAARDEIIASGGSISHHHGVGKLRKKWYKDTVSEPGRQLLLAAKKALDPDNIFALDNMVDWDQSEPVRSKL